MTTQCTICAKPRSPFILNNRTVCLHCDELLFDLEIECEEIELPKTETPTGRDKTQEKNEKTLRMISKKTASTK